MGDLMAELTVTQTREQFAEVLGRIQFGGERVTIRKHGKVVAGIVSADDLAILAQYDAAEDRILSEMGEEAYAEHLKNPQSTIGHDALWDSIIASVEKAGGTAE